MDTVSEISQIHNLTHKEESRLRDYFFYLSSIPGNADISKFSELMKTKSKEYVLKFTKSDKLIFIISNSTKDMNTTKAPTEDEILECVSLFFKTLNSQKGKIPKETASFYLFNYTGYGLNNPQLKNKTPQEIKELRFSGAYRLFKKLPSDGFWFLYKLFETGKLPSLEDTY